jgi:hypothetical protein
MFELIRKWGVVPKSLFVTCITTTTSLEAIDFRGERDGKQVMLQVVYKVHEDVRALQLSSLPILIRLVLGFTQKSFLS